MEFFLITKVNDLRYVILKLICFSKSFMYYLVAGALLVKNSSSHFLKKTYFGGGAVQVSLASERYHVNRPTVTEMLVSNIEKSGIGKVIFL